MSVLAAGVIGSAVVGAISTNAASRRAADAQNNATAAQTSVASRQLQMAEDQWNRYTSIYGPLEEEVVQEARDYGSEANKAKAAQEAAGAVTSSYANLRSQLNSTPGLDPSSQKYIRSLERIKLDEAAQSAAAQTGARRYVEATGSAMKKDATALGKGLPASAEAALRGAGASAGALASQAQQAGANAAAGSYGIGRMFGDVLTNPSVINRIGGMFAPTPAAGNGNGGYSAGGTAFNNPAAYVPPGYSPTGEWIGG